MDWERLAGTIGVPAAIAFFVLWRLNGKLARLIEIGTKVETAGQQMAVAAEKIEHAVNNLLESLRWARRTVGPGPGPSQ